MVTEVFTDVIRNLADMGILDVILPFLLFFTILFAVLQKTKVLGVDEEDKPQKNFNVVIALVIALMIVVPHVLYNAGSDNTTLGNTNWPDPVNIINKSLPQIAVIAVAIVMVMMLLGLVGAKSELNSDHTVWAAIAAAVIVIAIFVMSMLDAVPRWLSDFFDESTLAIVIILLVFGLIIRWIIKE